MTRQLADKLPNQTNQGDETPSAIRNSLNRLFRLILPFALFLLGASLCGIFGLAVYMIVEGEHYMLYGTNYVTLESIAVYGFLIIFLLLLTTFPALLIMGYQKLRIKDITIRTEQDLQLCGLRGEELKTLMGSFERRTNFFSFIFPTLIMIPFLFFYWALIFGPRGFEGLLYSAGLGGKIGRIAILGIPELIEFWIVHSSPIVWAFIGAYFYILTAITRRWVRSDLTVGYLWRINLRLVTVFILGLLFGLLAPFVTSLAPESTQATTVTLSDSTYGGLILRRLTDGDRILMLIAFLAGIAPDMAINWLIRRVQSLVNINGSKGLGDWATSIFKPSNMQQHIEGMNFWQADRLIEEGVEEIQNLATKDLPEILLNTRFDTARILNWMDQAILYVHAGQLLPIRVLNAAGIYKATDLLDRWRATKNQGEKDAFVDTLIIATRLYHPDDTVRTELIKLMDDEKNTIKWRAFVENLVQNIVTSEETGANINFIHKYWQNSDPEMRHQQLAKS